MAKHESTGGSGKEINPFIFLRDEKVLKPEEEINPRLRRVNPEVRTEEIEDVDFEKIALSILRAHIAGRGRVRDIESALQDKLLRLHREDKIDLRVPSRVEKLIKEGLVKAIGKLSGGTILSSAEAGKLQQDVPGIIRGVVAVNRAIKELEGEFGSSHKEGEGQFIGTNVELDARHAIDLVEVVYNQEAVKTVKLIQVKNSVMPPEDIFKIHQAHKEFYRTVLTAGQAEILKRSEAGLGQYGERIRVFLEVIEGKVSKSEVFAEVEKRFGTFFQECLLEAIEDGLLNEDILRKKLDTFEDSLSPTEVALFIGTKNFRDFFAEISEDFSGLPEEKWTEEARTHFEQNYAFLKNWALGVKKDLAILRRLDPTWQLDLSFLTKGVKIISVVRHGQEEDSQIL